MSAPPRAARARLRVLPGPHRPHIDTAFAELHAATGSLLAAAAGLSAALKDGMIDHGDVYELLRTVHGRLAQSVVAAEKAALHPEGEA